MKQSDLYHALMRRGIAWVLLCSGLSAQTLKVKEDHGHLSPVRVKVTFVSGKTRDAVLVGIGEHNSYLSHVFGVVLDAGTNPRSLWLDSIMSIRGTDQLRRLTDEFTVTMKDGREVQATFGEGGSCGVAGQVDIQFQYLCKYLVLRYEDDSIQEANLLAVKQVDFLGATRKDRAGNAMFDHWRYSPYTGERLGQ